MFLRPLLLVALTALAACSVPPNLSSLGPKDRGACTYTDLSGTSAASQAMLLWSANSARLSAPSLLSEGAIGTNDVKIENGTVQARFFPRADERIDVLANGRSVTLAFYVRSAADWSIAFQDGPHAADCNG